MSNPTTDQKTHDYLDHPPQRYAHEFQRISGSREMVEHPEGEWVKHEDMDLYMFEGAELMKLAIATNQQANDQLTAERKLRLQAEHERDCAVEDVKRFALAFEELGKHVFGGGWLDHAAECPTGLTDDDVCTCGLADWLKRFEGPLGINCPWPPSAPDVGGGA